MLFELIHFVDVLRDRGRKDKSPADNLSPRSSPLKSEVNPLQELTRVCYELFNNPLQILGMHPSLGSTVSHCIYLYKTSWNSLRVTRC